MGARLNTQCVFCGDVPANLPLHMWRRHIQEKPFHCRVCNMEFDVKANLKYHEKIHAQEDNPTEQADPNETPRPYPCPDPHCSYTAKTKSQLAIHLAFHSSQQVVKCSVCSIKFFTSGDHEQHFSSQKAYKCLLCPEGFPTSERVRDHLRQEHLGKKVHICGICGKEFGFEEGLNQHKKTCVNYCRNYRH